MILFQAHHKTQTSAIWKIEADRLPLFGRTQGNYVSRTAQNTTWNVYNSCVLMNGQSSSSFYKGFMLIFDQPTTVTFTWSSSTWTIYYNTLENGIYKANSNANLIKIIDEIYYIGDRNDGGTVQFIIDEANIPYTDDWETYKSNVTSLLPNPAITSNGGGATHIAKVTGQLSSLSNNLSDILMVSGGGGGGMLVDSTANGGADAGGISGNGTLSADQTTGYGFGQGESGTNVSGGGGGLYGGYKGTSALSGGAGSGYIGNSLLSNKKMVGYNVPTSSAESTKTESVNEASKSPVSGKPKIGNGHARIKFLREPVQKTIEELAKNTDYNTHRQTTTYSGTSILFASTMSNLSQYYKSDYILAGANNSGKWIEYSNNEFVQTYNQTSSGIAIPISDSVLITKLIYDLKMPVRNGDWDTSAIQLIHIENGAPVEKAYKRYKKPNSSVSGGEEVDNDYHTYEIEFDAPVQADYFYIGVGNTSCYVKNIKLTVL